MTATERAAEVLRRARLAAAASPHGWRWLTRDAVAALMADPDLLVDLAIEAGVSVGAMFEQLASRCTDEQAVLLWNLAADEVHRRREANDA